MVSLVYQKVDFHCATLPSLQVVWVNWNHVAFWPVHLQQEHKGDRGDQQAARPVASAQKVQALECA